MKLKDDKQMKLTADLEGVVGDCVRVRVLGQLLDVPAYRALQHLDNLKCQPLDARDLVQVDNLRRRILRGE